MDTPFGVDWANLDYAGLAAFLTTAEEEPLTWEAKGGGPEPIRAAQIAKAVCGFANSELGGFLVLGFARNGPGPWHTSPAQLPGDEPGLWLDQVISAGLSPIPRTEWRALARDEHGVVGVLHVDPVDRPPAITSGGTVYERGPGRTIPVSDPAGLRHLFERGERAARKVEALADEAIAAAGLPLGPDVAPATAVIAIAAPGLGGPALLRNEVADTARRLLRELFAGIERGGPERTVFQQDRVGVLVTGRLAAEELRWIQWSTHGWVMFASTTGEAISPRHVARELEKDLEVRHGLRALVAFLVEAGGRGPLEIRLRLDTDRGVVYLRRQCEPQLIGDELLASLAREVLRFGGQAGWEP